MKQVIDFFTGLFDTSLWPPRWHCGNWSDFHGWFYIISDLLIWSAYFAIPIIILNYISKRKELRFHKIYLLFASFILACGLTHFLDATMFWVPMYRLNALVRFGASVLSWATVYGLIRIHPSAFSLKTSKELEIEVEQRKKAEEELRFKNQQLNEAQQIAKLGHWKWNLQTDIITWSDELFRIYELPIAENGILYSEFLKFVHPDDKANVDAVIKQSMMDKKFSSYYYRIVTAAGTVKTLHAKGEIITDSAGNIIKMIGTGQDVTDQKKIEQELTVKTAELRSMNEELQKFAYVASHDLQEPLRKIKTYISILEGDGLITEDQKKVYRSKIVTSATRMQKLIDDILSFSKLSSNIAVFKRVSLAEIVQIVISDMEVTIESSNANIIIENLPFIEANVTQMCQLFQNLISNSIKFKKKEIAPQIKISSTIITGKNLKSDAKIKNRYKFLEWDESKYWAREKFCHIKIEDNGIGFESIYAERIFEAFQRLTVENNYEGTGIGLAICKKIVENHHGEIMAESVLNEGTVINIILPLSQANFESTIK